MPQRYSRFQKVLRFFPMLSMMAGIFYVSNQPGNVFRLPKIPGIDKLLHAGAYGMLALTVLFAIQPFSIKCSGRWFAIGVVLFCLFYGISDEFHQSFVPHRSVSIWDVAADVIGGMVVVFYWYKMHQPVSSSRRA